MGPGGPVGWLLRVPVLLKVALVAGAAVTVYLGVTFVQVWQASRADGARSAQAIVVLGAAQYDGEPSPVLRARLDHSADLYHRGLAPTIVVTGGKEEGDRFSEATAGARYLHGEGVPDEDILRETSGRSSWESLAASARFLRDRGIEEVMLVSDPFHAERVDAIAEEVGFDASVSPTPDSPIRGREEWQRMASETVKVAVGRVVGFRRLVNLSDVSSGPAPDGVPRRRARPPRSGPDPDPGPPGPRAARSAALGGDSPREGRQIAQNVRR